MRPRGAMRRGSTSSSGLSGTSRLWAVPFCVVVLGVTSCGSDAGSDPGGERPPTAAVAATASAPAPPAADGEVPKLTKLVLVRFSGPARLYAIARYRGYDSSDDARFAVFDDPTLTWRGRDALLVPLGAPSSGCFMSILGTGARLRGVDDGKRYRVRLRFADSRAGSGSHHVRVRVEASTSTYARVAERRLGCRIER
ncbi:hypothetical protein AB0L40_04835 [Patulibacter sp. NPDC049589]|uniref:hypothetical protein n=1 Tax=Patulibacter sp. NPDC049589 TaxID=3154731 RepID=UPI00343FB55F